MEIAQLQTIGSLDSTELLNMLGEKFAISNGEIQELSNKKILSIGEGTSNFVNYIRNFAKNSHFTIADPIYKNSEKFQKYVGKTIENIQFSISLAKEDLITTLEFGDNPDQNEIDYFTMQRTRLSTTLKIAKRDEFKQKNTKNTMVDDFTNIKKESQDIIFINHLIYEIKNPQQFLQDVKSLLKEKGYLVIIDYDDKIIKNMTKQRYVEILETKKDNISFKIPKDSISKIQRNNYITNYKNSAKSPLTITDALQELSKILKEQKEV